MILNMWAGLCPPCRAEMPELEAVHQQYGDRIFVFGLDLGSFTGLGNQDDAMDLINQTGITYPTGNTPESNVIVSYEVLGMPTTYFINTDGYIVNKWTGTITQTQMIDLIEKLIGS